MKYIAKSWLPLAGVAALFLGWRLTGQAVAVSDRPAPEFVGGTWLNTPNGAPVTLASRKGKVTLVEFWAAECSNCRANMSAYSKWSKEYAARGVKVIGVHTAELPYEKVASHVEEVVKMLGITYPVLLDTSGTNWDRWHQQYWPTIYLIDKKGRERFKWEGELEYGGGGGIKQVTAHLEELLQEGKK